MAADSRVQASPCFDFTMGEGRLSAPRSGNVPDPSLMPAHHMGVEDNCVSDRISQVHVNTGCQIKGSSLKTVPTGMTHSDRTPTGMPHSDRTMQRRSFGNADGGCACRGCDIPIAMSLPSPCEWTSLPSGRSGRATAPQPCVIQDANAVIALLSNPATRGTSRWRSTPTPARVAESRLDFDREIGGGPKPGARCRKTVAAPLA